MPRSTTQTTYRILLFLVIAPLSVCRAQAGSHHWRVPHEQAISGELAVSRLHVSEEVAESGLLDYEDTRVLWQMRLVGPFRDFRIWHVTFPSPLATPVEENNTVHAELHIPAGDGPFPGAVILHILDGELNASRLIASDFVAHGIAAMIVIMPGYRERRGEGQPKGFVSEDIERLTQGVRQAIMDTARAGEVMRALPQVQSDKVCLVGASLGGFVGSAVAAVDHRFPRAVLVLAGGGLADVLFNKARETRRVAERLEAAGYTREELREKLAKIDPLTYAPHMGADRALLINALDDEVVPRECALELARAIGTERQMWYPGTHVGILANVISMLNESRRFLFGEEYLVPLALREATPPSP